uniref:MICOS complex subunit MIC13 n=1 Tax=Calidris pygmaea TaxID=425635 RepID=A0A8C3J6X7_9CHAR
FLEALTSPTEGSHCQRLPRDSLEQIIGGWDCSRQRQKAGGCNAEEPLALSYEAERPSGTQGAEALRKAQAALPPAIQEWTSYIGWELPPTPKFDFSPSDSWNKGVQTVMSALSVAPTRACEYTVEGWKYVKDPVK